MKKILRSFPKINKEIENIYRLLIISKRFIYRVVNIAIKGNKAVDVDKIYWIDPKQIKFHTDWKDIKSPNIEDRVFNMHKNKGKVLDGDWDLSTYLFTNLDIYKAFDDVINNNTPWKDTKFYQNRLKEIDNGRVLWECHSKSDFDQRCKILNALIESIRKNGYRLNSTCYLEGENKGVRGYFEEITVNIARDGKYLFQDGRHRLSIALILKIEKIPVRVLVRHKLYKAS